MGVLDNQVEGSTGGFFFQRPIVDPRGAPSAGRQNVSCRRAASLAWTPGLREVETCEKRRTVDVIYEFDFKITNLNLSISSSTCAIAKYEYAIL